MRILGIERDTSACNHHRILQPLYKLREHNLADCLTIGEREMHTNYAVDKVSEADIIIFQRSNNKMWYDFIKTCQKMGKTIVSDYDDDPFETHPLNPHYQVSGTKEYKYTWPDGTVEWLWKDGESNFCVEENMERMDMFRASFKQSDLVTTTTPLLAETFKKINTNVAVLPNVVDFNYWPKIPKMKKGRVRIGYQGGYSHYPDLFMILDQIVDVVKNNDVEFVFFGDYRFAEMFKDIPEDKFEFHHWRKHNAYPYALSLMNIDIGLCPLVDNEFNRKKSALKWMDYSMVGASTIASDIPPYSPVMSDKESVLVKPLEWKDALEDLIKDKKKRKRLAKNSYDKVFEEHNVDKKIHLWKDAYDKVLKQDIII